MTISDAALSVESRARRRNGAVLPVFVVGVCLAVAVAWLEPISAAVALSLYLATGAVVIFRLRPFHPFERFGSANVVTLVRAAMVAFLTGWMTIGDDGSDGDFLVFAIAVLILALDGLDGWLARRTGTVSRFGARFDMEIDALLIMALSAFAFLDDKTAAWVLLLGLMRYAFVAAGRVFPTLAADLPTSLRRKIVCVFQIIVLAILALPFVASPLSDLLALAALALLSWSFLVDTLWLLKAPRAI